MYVPAFDDTTPVNPLASARAAQRPPGLTKEFWRRAALTVAPVMIFAAVAFGLLALRDHELRKTGLIRAANTFTAAVDREIAAQTAGLVTLSASDALDHGDLSTFYREATRVAGMQPEWLSIILSDRTGQQLVNTLRPLGSVLPVFPHMDSHNLVVAEKRTVVVSRPHALGPTSAQPIYGMRAPVVRDGEVKYVLTSTFAPVFIGKVLDQAALPRDVTGLIVNEHGRLLARIGLGGIVTMMTGAEAVIVDGDALTSAGAVAVGPTTGWRVHLSRDLGSEIVYLARRLWLLGVAGVLSLAVGLLSLSTFMEQRKRAEETLEAQVRARTSELAAAMAQKDLLLEELHHRVNNNLQIVGSLVRLQERGSLRRGASEAAAPLTLLRGRLNSLFVVHQEMAAPLPLVDLGETLKRVAEALLSPSGAVEVSGEVTYVRRDPALNLAFALCELLRFASAHTLGEPQRRVRLQIERRGTFAEITVVVTAAGETLTIPDDDAELILLLADQGRGTAKIASSLGEIRLFMLVPVVS